MKNPLKIIASSIIAATLVAVPVLVSAKETPFDQADVSCVAKAVDVRESTLEAGYSDFASSTQKAYSVRRAELKTAYTASSSPAIRAGVKKSWANFSETLQDAREEWRKTRNAAWKSFRSSAATCSADPLIQDTANAAMEASGL